MGSGTDTAILDGNADSRILRFESTNSLSISRFTVTNINPDADEGGAFRIVQAPFYAGHVNFEDGDCTGNEDGCGFMIQNSPGFEVEYCNFTGNQAVWDGAIWIDNTPGTARHLNVVGNSVSTRGAGITVWGGSVVNLDSINFEDNFTTGTADFAALQVGTGSTVVLTNATFKNNTSADQGGAIGVFDSANLTIKNTAFIDNSAGSTGAAIHANTSATVNIYNSWFYNNNDGGGTGATDHCHSEGGATVTIYSSLFDSIDTGCTSEPSNFTAADFGLGAFELHNGFAKSFAIAADSPLIDASDPTQCPDRDSRSYLRPTDGNGDSDAVCDIGPYELHP
jgi:predicted outer membrane repeat protein